MNRAASVKGWVSTRETPSQPRAANIPAETVTGPQATAACHGLYQVEQSFRMAKSDLAARPEVGRSGLVFYRQRGRPSGGPSANAAVPAPQ